MRALLCVHSIALALGAVPVGEPADPLPVGAVLRLGDPRLRHAGLCDFVVLADGKTLLTAGSDRVLRCWELATGKLIRTTSLGDATTSAVALSPDGRLVAGQVRGRVVVWHADTMKEAASLPTSDAPFVRLAFSADGGTVARVVEGQALCWNWRQGRSRAIALGAATPLSRLFNRIQPVLLSADGALLVLGGGPGEGPVNVFETLTGRHRWQMDDRPTAAALSLDGKTLYLASVRIAPGKGERETVLRRYDPMTGEEGAAIPVEEGQPARFSLAFSPDGKWLACVGINGVVGIRDAESGRELLRVPGEVASLEDIPSRAIFSPDGKTLLFADGPALRVWDLIGGRERHDRPAGFATLPVLAFAPDGRCLASGGFHPQTVTLWDTAIGRPHALPLPGDKAGYVTGLSFADDGKSLIVARFWPAAFEVFDLAAGKGRTIGREDGDRFALNQQPHVAPDGKSVSAVEAVFELKGEGARLRRWELPTGKLVWDHPLQGDWPTACWLDNGEAVAVVTDAGLALLEAKTATARFRLPRVAAPVAASSDGRLLAARAGADGDEVGIWETASGQRIARVKPGRPYHLALLSGGRALVVVTGSALSVWDVAKGKEVARHELPVPGLDARGRSFVAALAVSPDGRRAVTSFQDGTALVWDVTLPRPSR